ncbi:hypothetical protein ST47_g368 [Ascochyta rabiei]|uniref:Uncharacterized protein n=1 Tax=Didymella rabiei TaxID=5454 RepID=A0A163M8P1_DIDRA|nr:hypothetical protein ST47_g368 [Ascochyta rabiei]
MYINYRHNGHSTHRSAFFISNEGFIILATTFGSILVFVTICLLAQHFIRSYHKDNSDYEIGPDLGAFRPLIGRRRSESYCTLPPASHDAFTRDRESRRMTRDERLRDNVAEVYRISTRRAGGGGSESSASSDSESEDGHRDARREEEEEEDESSGSDSDSSSDSDDDDGYEVADRQELVYMRRSALPKRVVVLRFYRG